MLNSIGSRSMPKGAKTAAATCSLMVIPAIKIKPITAIMTCAFRVPERGSVKRSPLGDG